MVVGLHVGGAETPLWLAWQFHPVLLAGLLVAGWLYARGLRASIGTRRKLHPWWRPILYYTSLVMIFVALSSPLDHLTSELFVAHMAQHLLLMVAPALVLLSAPFIPVLRGIPRGVRRSIVAPVLRHPALRRPLKLLSLPLIAWPLFAVTMLGWHAPPAYELALRSDTAHLLEHGAFIGGALLFWWNVIDAVPLRGNLPYLARAPYIFLMTIPNFSLGAFLTFSPKAWYAQYQTGTLTWGLSALEDQQIGALLMWIPGALVLLSALLLVLVYAVLSEERRQQEREARALIGPRRISH
jgi:putative membrane protein